MADIEDITASVEPLKEHPYAPLMRHILDHPQESIDTFEKVRALMLDFLTGTKQAIPSKRALGMAYRNVMELEGDVRLPNRSLQTMLIHKSIRSASGILNISLSLPPDKFSCKYDCAMCPNEPGMPRSYLSNEAVFRRAARVGFDTVKQVYKRLGDCDMNGHTIDKIEYRVLGGTFSCYDHGVADDFIRDLYYAANTYFEDRGRDKGTIEEEQALNVTAKVHVVGLGVETRPDTVTEAEIVRFRRYGITRVEIGVQHTDDNLLRRINRGHLTKHSKAAIKLLKDYGFKVEIHVMADLPGATPEGDMDCYEEILQGPDLLPDYMKDYPCLDVDFTKVKEWKKSGAWKPYAEATPDARDLKRVLIYRQAITPRFVRVNRIHRDFQEAREGCVGFSSHSIKTNLAQIVKDEAEAQGIFCQCIRCCEVRGQSFDPAEIQYKVDEFEASGAQEYFLYAQVERASRPLLLGFLRLRLGDLSESVISELRGRDEGNRVAMIRELHVYGSLKAVGASDASGNSAQHLGIGKRLLETAERIATQAGYDEIAVISGIGVRGYYAKRGYELRGSYMMKELLPMAEEIASIEKESEEEDDDLVAFLLFMLLFFGGAVAAVLIKMNV